MKQQQENRYALDEIKVRSFDSVLMKRLFAYLNPYRTWVTIVVFVLILASLLEAWIPLQIGQAAQMIIGHQEDSDFEKQKIFQALLIFCGSILGWIVLNYVLDVITILIKNWIGQKAIFTLRTQVYAHIQRLPISFFDHHAIGRLMTRTIHDVDQINQLLSESIIPLIGSFVLFIGILIGVFFVNWQMGVIFCIIFPLIWCLVQYFRHQQRKSYSRMSAILSATNAFIQEHLMGVHIVRHFGLHETERHKFRELSGDFLQSNLEVIRQFSFFFSGTEFLRSLTMICAFLVLAYFSPHGLGLQIGAYFTLSIYTLMIFRPLLSLAERYNVLQSAMAAAERIFEVLDTPTEPIGDQPGFPLKEIESIEFEKVWFAYEEENWVLKGLSFSMVKGESLAFVGVTGSGKTSVMNLLLRFYEFQKGRILINGREIHCYSVETLRQQFSAVLQDPVIFSGTVYHNISLYDSSITIGQVEASVQFVNLMPVINRFPDRFEHVLTERGGSLSVGEMQLIALARAVTHRRNVLILDEATSNIDVQTEKTIQETIKKMLGHQTAIVIAHRLSTIKDVTRIIVLSKGIIIESGTHQQLLEKGGMYEKLYRLQFAKES